MDAAGDEKEEGTRPDSHINAGHSITYWNSIAPDVNGMLGGYPQISRIDLRGSQTFVTKIRQFTSNCRVRNAPKLSQGVDCGAGIGRITAGLLTKICETVDVVEPIEKFAQAVMEGDLKKEGRVGEVYVQGLQDWIPSKPYDLIWNQWCLGHLTDAQLVTYLQRCSATLAQNGWIVVKENLSTDRCGADIFDTRDSSVTRSDNKFRNLFKQAGLLIVKTEIQSGFPKGLGLFPVRMYALRPF